MNYYEFLSWIKDLIFANKDNEKLQSILNRINRILLGKFNDSTLDRIYGAMKEVLALENEMKINFSSATIDTVLKTLTDPDSIEIFANSYPTEEVLEALAEEFYNVKKPAQKGNVTSSLQARCLEKLSSGFSGGNPPIQINDVLLKISSWDVDESLVTLKIKTALDFLKLDPKHIALIQDERLKFADEILEYIVILSKEFTDHFISLHNKGRYQKLDLACDFLKLILTGTSSADLINNIKSAKDTRLERILNHYNSSPLADVFKNKIIGQSAEKNLAYQIVDTGRVWKISNMDFFSSLFYKRWRSVRGGESVDFIEREADLQTDALKRLEKDGKFRPMGNCYDQARVNLLYLSCLKLQDNSMKGKTAIQVQATTSDHAYLVITKLTKEELAAITNKETLCLDLVKLKQNDPSSYIIDSWRMGFYNEPKKFLHWSPFKEGKLENGLAENPTEVFMQNLGVVGHPEEGLFQMSIDQQKNITWNSTPINLERLDNTPAWVQYKQKVGTRYLPDKIIEVMENQDRVITYKH